jgi:2-oxoglutarate dehydrogenase E2 component (dihydrolipoamide succinyltransferase)
MAAPTARAPGVSAGAAPIAPSAGRTVAPTPRSGTGDTVEPLNNIRRRTGEHMVQSKATSPHAYTIVEVDYENVERVRRRHRDDWKAAEGFSLTYLPFISRAVIDALHDYPHLNATVGDGELIVHNYVNLAVAVDLDFEGLLAPVVHEADEKRLRGLARDIDDLATRARAKRLSVDDITGGTFTLSNSGSFGSYLVLPIINQPQVAILSTDGITRKPVVVTGPDGTEAIAIHSVGLLGLSWDHRAFDGAYAAAFLREVKTIIETRDWEAEL